MPTTFPPGVRSGVGAGLLVSVLAVTPGACAAQAGSSGSAAAGAAGRSLLLPGWGQAHLGQRRAVVYAVAEAAFLALWAERHHRGSTLRNEFRDLAWREARIQSGNRSDPDWAYYETMSKWSRSGAFDGDPQAAGVQPESDPATYNGSIWRLAVDQFVPGGAAPEPGGPGHASALSWYRSHAYETPYLWDWSGKEARLVEYKDLIHTSDRRFSQATAALGAVLANHLLSATDAFVSARVPGAAQVRVGAPGPLGVARPGILISWNPPW